MHFIRGFLFSFSVFPLIFLSLGAQNVLLPGKLIVFRDGAQLTLKGNLRFDNQKAFVSPGYEFAPGSLELGKTRDYEVRYIKTVTDSTSHLRPANSWKEVMDANRGRIMTIGYLIGNEFDEVTGTVSMLDQQGKIFCLRTYNGKQFFIPIEQVRHVIVDSGGVYNIEHKEIIQGLEIGINKDIQFVPIELTGSISQISWAPNCKLQLLSDKAARYQVTTVVKNPGWDLPETEIELSPNSLFAADPSEPSSKETFKIGKLSLKKGEDLMLNLKESVHEYQSIYIADIPWSEPDGRHYAKLEIPVDYFLRFSNPVQLSGACTSLTLADENNRVLSQLSVNNPNPAGTSDLKISSDYAVRIEFQETELKRQPKPIRINDKLFVKAEIQGKLVILNTKSEAVSVRINRQLQGNLLDNGGGTVENVTATSIGNLNYIATLRAGQSREIVYKYDAMVPAGN